MEKRILVIDDRKDNVILEEIERAVGAEINEGAHHQYDINVDYYDPIEKIDDGDVEGMLDDLQSQYLDDRLDLLLCDFNLTSEDKLLAYEIVVRVRENNKCCSIVMYSGNPFKDLVRLEYDGLAEYLANNVSANEGGLGQGPVRQAINGYIKQEIKDFSPLEKAACSNIRAFISRKTGVIVDHAIECLLDPLLPMRIEDALLAHSSLIISNGMPALDGVPFIDVANEIRKGTANGQKYQQQIIDSGLALLIDND